MKKYQVETQDNHLPIYNLIARKLIHIVSHRTSPNSLMLVAFLLIFLPFAWLFSIYGTKFENEEFVIPKWQFYMQALAYFLAKVASKMSKL